MSLMWMILAGVIAAIVAKVVLPRFAAGGLFLLGIGGAMIAGLIRDAQNEPVGFVGPLLGAAALLILHAFTARPAPAETAAEHEDWRRAA